MSQHRSGPRKSAPLLPAAWVLAALLLAVVLAPAAATAAAADGARIEPQGAASPPAPGPPLAPPAGKAGLAEPPAPDPPAGKSRPTVYSGISFPIPTLVYPLGMTHGLWVGFDLLVAHDMHDGMLAPARHYQVILRDGVSLPALDEPKLADGAVRFSDLHGTLVAVRASEVDLPATAAANHLDSAAQPSGRPPAAAAAAPAVSAPPDGPPR